MDQSEYKYIKELTETAVDIIKKYYNEKEYHIYECIHYSLIKHCVSLNDIFKLFTHTLLTSLDKPKRSIKEDLTVFCKLKDAGFDVGQCIRVVFTIND